MLWKWKLFRQLNSNLNGIEDSFNHIIKKLKESSLIFDKLLNLINKYYSNEILQKQIYQQMKNMFLSLESALKRERDIIKIDIKENFNFFSKNYSNFYQLVNWYNLLILCLIKKLSYFIISKKNYF